MLLLLVFKVMFHACPCNISTKSDKQNFENKDGLFFLEHVWEHGANHVPSNFEKLFVLKIIFLCFQIVLMC